MANVWVGDDYYASSIDKTGDNFNISFNSTTTSNSFVYEIGKNTHGINVRSVGAAIQVWLDVPFDNPGNGDSFNWDWGQSSDDSRRIVMTPSSTDSANGTGLSVVVAVAANGYPILSEYQTSFDVANSNTVPYAVDATSAGTGYVEQDNITFTNISGGSNNTSVSHNFNGNIVWTDTVCPILSVGESDAVLASNATYYMNNLISIGHWTP